MSILEQVVETAGPHGHILQLYHADEDVLTRNIGRYLYGGLNRGEGLLVIADERHRAAVQRQLKLSGADPAKAIREGQLVLLDAGETLAQFMRNGQPDWQLFRATIGSAMLRVRSRDEHAGLRAYGEMVGILWKQEQHEAAIRLEEFWNKLLSMGGFKLYCAYPIDVFGKDFETEAVHQLLCAHTHLLPAGENGEMENALDRAAEAVLGRGLGTGFEAARRPAWAMLPRAEASILSLRTQYPEQADEVLARARDHYRGEKRFRALIENSSDAILLIDPAGNLLYASPSNRAVLGYEPWELLGRGVFQLIHPEDAGAARKAFDEAVQNPRCPVLTAARVRHKDGDWRWVECTISNLLDEPDVGSIVCNYRDISERKAAEQRQQRYAEDLARSNAELQSFAYAVSHDLKEPLRTICAFTQLLVQGGETDEKTKQDYAGFVVDGVKRMSALLDDLLSLTSLTFGGERESVELSEAAGEAVRNLAIAIDESGAAIRIHPLPAVTGNRSHIVELFQNLIANAIKYRRNVPVEIHMTAEQRDGEYVVRVSDNGIGIPPAYSAQIFGLFKRLHSRTAAPGTGIGLAICKKVVEGMGGRIWVESEEGKGSTFCFTSKPAAALTSAYSASSAARIAG